MPLAILTVCHTHTHTCVLLVSLGLFAKALEAHGLAQGAPGPCGWLDLMDGWWWGNHRMDGWMEGPWPKGHPIHMNYVDGCFCSPRQVMLISCTVSPKCYMGGEEDQRALPCVGSSC